MEAEISKTKKRDPLYDVLRGMAIINVVMIHTTADYAWADGGSKVYGLMNLVNKLFQCGVPIFVMLTVFLALRGGRRLSPAYFFRKSLPLAALYLVWTFVYLLIQCGGDIYLFPDTRTLILKNLLQGTTFYHLYYVVMLILLYLLLPLTSLLPIKKLRPSAALLAGVTAAQLAVVAVMMKYVVWPLGLATSALLPVFYLVPITLGLLMAADAEGTKRYFREHGAAFGLMWGLAIAANGWLATQGVEYFAARPLASTVWYNLLFCVNALGGTALLTTLAEKLRGSKVLALLGRHTLAIYFAHPLALYAVDLTGRFLGGSTLALLAGMAAKGASALALALVYSFLAEKCNTLFKNLRQKRNRS